MSRKAVARTRKPAPAPAPRLTPPPLHLLADASVDVRLARLRPLLDTTCGECKQPFDEHSLYTHGRPVVLRESGGGTITELYECSHCAVRYIPMHVGGSFRYSHDPLWAPSNQSSAQELDLKLRGFTHAAYPRYVVVVIP